MSRQTHKTRRRRPRPSDNFGNSNFLSKIFTPAKRLYSSVNLSAHPRLFTTPASLFPKRLPTLFAVVLPTETHAIPRCTLRTNKRQHTSAPNRHASTVTRDAVPSRQRETTLLHLLLRGGLPTPEGYRQSTLSIRQPWSHTIHSSLRSHGPLPLAALTLHWRPTGGGMCGPILRA